MPFGKQNRVTKEMPLLQEKRLTLTTVASAKGMDAPLVFILGADLFADSTRGRASFYVAATRAKMRLFISGVRDSSPLAVEIEKVSNLLTSATAHADVASTTVSVPASISSLLSQSEIDKFVRGRIVRHTKYGAGVLLTDAVAILENSMHVPKHGVTVHFKKAGRLELVIEAENLIATDRMVC